jgi:hypothetical protein
MEVGVVAMIAQFVACVGAVDMDSMACEHGVCGVKGVQNLYTYLHMTAVTTPPTRQERE